MSTKTGSIPENLTLITRPDLYLKGNLAGNLYPIK